MKECSSCQRCFSDQGDYCPHDGARLTPSLLGEPILDGRYQLRRRLGQGGMGAVYKARHIFLKTTHAIKVILPDLVGNDPELATRFRQEAMAAAAIRHYNVIAVTDYGLVGGKMPFLVREYVQGRSLHDVLAEEKRLAPARALDFMEPILAGVGAAHRRSIVHRDLKPLNIMIEDGVPLRDAVKVLDFGLAKIKSGELLGSFVAAKTTGIMGSPFYMAPEQWSDEEPDARADIYSLGIILYQMLAGDVPFKGPSVPSIMKKHLLSEPPRFAEAGAAVAPEVEAVVRRALEKDPNDRPSTTTEFFDELRAAVAANYSLKGPALEQGGQADTLMAEALEAQLAGTISANSAMEPPDSAVMAEARSREAEARRQWEEAARQAEELKQVEAERRRREEEAKRRRAEEEEAARLKAEKEARLAEEARAAEEARQRAEAEAARQRAAEEAQRRVAEEALRRAEEERQQREAEEQRQREVEEQRRKEEEEARRREAEETAR
ncbi:MAG: serine/threonine-protein kinase [Pyrinomonadaceae bacterium]